jgi:AraC-like DNA-binding protein/ligand-binding sensor protein
VPRIIRQSLTERIRRDAGLQTMLRDLSLATGLRASFASPLGVRDDVPDAFDAPLCARLRRSGEGCRMCLHFHQALCDSAATAPAYARCDAGLAECAVPLRAAGQTLGYLMVGGYLPGPPTPATVNRTRHLLARDGVDVAEPEIADLLQRAPVVGAERQAALLNVLGLAAEHVAGVITERLLHVHDAMPPLVEKACHRVHAQFAETLTVGDVARQLGVSEGHLSRTFHQATGLRFVEYVARFRAERARTLLRETDRPVTEIAFASGFQSLSQFNRVFRAQFGRSPRVWRREARRGTAPATGN